MMAERRKPPSRSVEALVAGSKRTSGLCVTIGCRVHESVVGIPRRFLSARIASLLMTGNSMLTRTYRGFGESFVEKQFESTWIEGEDRLTLRFTSEAAKTLEELCNDRLIARLNDSIEWCAVTSLLIGDRVPPVPILAFSSYPGGDPGRYLTAKALKHTLIRSTDGWYECQFLKESLRKNIVHSFRYSTSYRGYRRQEV